MIQKALAADHEVTVAETTRKGQAIRLAHGAARSGTEVVVTLGGDGTINEAVNGLLGETCWVAPLPGGSTNVFARTVGYPNDAIEATGTLLEALADRSVIEASVGMANKRAFLFHVGTGLDAAVVARVERRGQLKRWVGHPFFVAATVATWCQQLSDHSSFMVETDDGRSVSGAQQAVAMNTTPYTFLGTKALHLTPEAGLDVPLSMAVLTTLWPRVLPNLLRSLRRPTGLASRSGAIHWDDVHGAVITSQTPFPYQLDGEVLDPVTELRLEHRPRAIQLVVPTKPNEG